MCDDDDIGRDLTDEASKLLVTDPACVRKAKSAWKKHRKRRNGVNTAWGELEQYLKRRFIKLLPKELSGFTTSAVKLVNFYSPADDILREHCDGYSKRRDRPPRPPKKGTWGRIIHDTAKVYVENEASAVLRRAQLFKAMKEKKPLKYNWDVAD